MAFEQNELSGSLFVNDRKERDNQPDYTGSCKVQGVEYYMSAWVKETRAGQEFFSIALTEKDVQSTGPSKARTIGRPTARSLADKQAEFEQMTGAKVDVDEDIPF